MAKTETIYAPSSWGEFDAIKALAKKLGGLDKVESFKREGARFAAVVRVADDDDGDKEGNDNDDGSDNGGGDDKPAFLKSDDEKSEGGDSDGGSEDSGDSGDGEGEGGDDDRAEPPFAEDGDEGKEPSIGEVFDLVKQIAEAVGVPIDNGLGEEGLLPTDDLGAGDLAAGPEPGLDLPDVGAPPAGGPALPPPVPAPAPAGPRGKPGAMPSFARVAGYDEAKAKKRSFDAFLQEAGSVSNKQIMDEAALLMPEHRVAKIDRTSRAQDDVAVVTLVAR